MDSTYSAFDGELLDALARLMTPFRRQFRQTLDANLFLTDPGYAQEVIDRLSSVEDPQILSTARFLRDRMPHRFAASAAVVPTDQAGVSGGRPSERATPSADLANPANAMTQYVKRLR